MSKKSIDVPSVSNSSQHTRANLPDGWSTKTPSLLWLRCMVVSWYLKVHDPNVVSTGKFTSKPSVVISELELSDERPKHVKEGGRRAARGIYYPTFVREKRKSTHFPPKFASLLRGVYVRTDCTLAHTRTGESAAQREGGDTVYDSPFGCERSLRKELPSAHAR